MGGGEGVQSNALVICDKSIPAPPTPDPITRTSITMQAPSLASPIRCTANSSGSSSSKGTAEALGTIYIIQSLPLRPAFYCTRHKVLLWDTFSGRCARRRSDWRLRTRKVEPRLIKHPFKNPRERGDWFILFLPPGSYLSELGDKWFCNIAATRKCALDRSRLSSDDMGRQLTTASMVVKWRGGGGGEGCVCGRGGGLIILACCQDDSATPLPPPSHPPPPKHPVFPLSFFFSPPFFFFLFLPLLFAPMRVTKAAKLNLEETLIT